MIKIHYRNATGADVEEMKRVIFQHGPNSYNYLPRKSVEVHLNNIEKGTVRAVLALRDGRIVGFVSFTWGRMVKRPKVLGKKDHGYIGEAVVDRELKGKGIGSRLLSLAVKELRAAGFDSIYAERHSENDASRRMMEKNGFVEIETFFDPKRRNYGSRKTTVSVLKLGRWQ